MEPTCGNYLLKFQASVLYEYSILLPSHFPNEITHSDSDINILMFDPRNKDKVILNNQSGYLMRTKVSSSNEGGVAAGFAVLDSILLTDEVIAPHNYLIREP
jgi:hypothetical protein